MSATQVAAEMTRSNGSTRVVMLGTGTPRPDPNRSGPATAIVVNDTPYLIDFGPGVIRRATAAYEKGVTALGYGGVNIKTVFLTHMHSDHTVGYPDLIFTPWVMGRHEPLAVYGPKGIKAMTEHVLKAWQVDIDVRTNGLNQHNSTGCRVNAHEIAPGVVYRDGNVTVTAFPARHEDMVDSFSFRFDTPDRAIVISGDTAPTQALIDHSRGCDVLVHEAYSMEAFARSRRMAGIPPTGPYIVSRAGGDRQHGEAGAARDLSPLKCRRRPGNVDNEEVLLRKIRQTYKGKVVAGHDLDVF